MDLDFLVSPELTLACLRQENHIHACQAEYYRLAQSTMGSRPSALAAVLSAIKAVISRACLDLKPKPRLNSLPASSASSR
jgi:hypothetical protein